MMSAELSHEAAFGRGGRPSVARPGSHGRLETFLIEHGDLVRRVVRHVGGRRAERLLEDVEQTVLIALWRRLESEPTLELTRSYVYKATLRETIRALRRESRHPLEPLSLEAPLRDGSRHGDPHGEASQRETMEAIEAGLAVLASDRRRAVRFHLLGFTVEEIMRLSGWPYQKARNLIARGTADLRDTLREGGFA